MGEEIEVRILEEGWDLEFFDCGEESINEFIKTKALEFQKALFSQVYIIVTGDKVIACMTLSAAQIRHDLEDIFGIVPCLLLGKLGVDHRYQGKGLGSFLISLAIKVTKEVSEKIGCRLLILDAFFKQIPYYEDKGFEILEDQKPREWKGIKTQKMKFDII